MRDLKKKKRQKIYAFIDSQNLNLGVGKDIWRKKKKVYKGWKLDSRKFRIYLKDKYKVAKAFMFIGYLEEYEPLYKSLRAYGFTLIFKPTIKDNHGNPKGNVDAELVLHSAAIEFPNYDKAIIVSGDGDFRCLVEYLKKKKKLGRLLIPNKTSYSSLLWKFNADLDFVSPLKKKLEYEGK